MEKRLVDDMVNPEVAFQFKCFLVLNPGFYSVFSMCLGSLFDFSLRDLLSLWSLWTVLKQQFPEVDDCTFTDVVSFYDDGNITVWIDPDDPESFVTWCEEDCPSESFSFSVSDATVSWLLERFQTATIFDGVSPPVEMSPSTFADCDIALPAEDVIVTEPKIWESSVKSADTAGLAELIFESPPLLDLALSYWFDYNHSNCLGTCTFCSPYVEAVSKHDRVPPDIKGAVRSNTCRADMDLSHLSDSVGIFLFTRRRSVAVSVEKSPVVVRDGVGYPPKT